MASPEPGCVMPDDRSALPFYISHCVHYRCTHLSAQKQGENHIMYCINVGRGGPCSADLVLNTKQALGDGMLAQC